MGTLAAATDGAFWLNVVAGNDNPFSVSQVAEYVGKFSATHLVLVRAQSGRPVLTLARLDR